MDSTTPVAPTGTPPIAAISPRSSARLRRSRSSSKSLSTPSTSRFSDWGASSELLELAPSWRLYPVVEALQALRGVQWVVALTVVAELGDLTRFDNPRQLAAFVGLIPSEHSSGDKRRLGGITKAGNSRARRVLVEGAWSYRYSAKVSARIQQRIETLPQAIQNIGWKAQLRLCKRFQKLIARGKHANVVVTAIAREMLAFMWAIAKEVPIEARCRPNISWLGTEARPRYGRNPRGRYEAAPADPRV